MTILFLWNLGCFLVGVGIGGLLWLLFQWLWLTVLDYFEDRKGD
jgi:hypothetical protein